MKTASVPEVTGSLNELQEPGLLSLVSSTETLRKQEIAKPKSCSSLKLSSPCRLSTWGGWVAAVLVAFQSRTTAGRVFEMGSGMKDQYISTKTAADELDLCPRSIQRLIKSGKIPAYKFGRDFRILLKDWERFKATYIIKVKAS